MVSDDGKTHRGSYDREQGQSALQTVSARASEHRLILGQMKVDSNHEVQFYLSSLEADAGKIGRAIRQHWGIENQLHWTLDVTFGEDSSRVRRGHGPENLGLLRRLARWRSQPGTII